MKALGHRNPLTRTVNRPCRPTTDVMGPRADLIPLMPNVYSVRSLDGNNDETFGVMVKLNAATLTAFTSMARGAKDVDGTCTVTLP